MAPREEMLAILTVICYLDGNSLFFLFVSALRLCCICQSHTAVSPEIDRHLQYLKKRTETGIETLLIN